MDPDFVMSRSDMGRRLLFAFSQYEIEQENKKRREAENKANRRGEGGSWLKRNISSGGQCRDYWRR